MKRAATTILLVSGLVGAGFYYANRSSAGARVDAGVQADEPSSTPAQTRAPTAPPAGSSVPKHSLAGLARATAEAASAEAARVSDAVANDARAAEAPTATAGEPLPEVYKPFRANNARYLKEILAPRLRECWGDVEGDGAIRVTHSFLIENGIARAAPIAGDSDFAVELVESDMSVEQDEVALDCLRRAAEGTEFEYVPMDEHDESTSLVLFQHWQSPERIERMRSSRAR